MPPPTEVGPVGPVVPVGDLPGFLRGDDGHVGLLGRVSTLTPPSLKYPWLVSPVEENPWVYRVAGRGGYYPPEISLDRGFGSTSRVDPRDGTD